MVKTIQMRPGARFGGELALLAALTALTRYVLRSHYLYDIDSVNFALALERFDPVSHQPHPPGYFLYVCLGRLSRLVFQDTNSALVALSVLFSCGAVVVIALLAAEWHGRAAARFAGLIFLFSPLAWFHGTVALTYIVEAFFSALTGFLCWRARTGGGRWVVAAAVTAGVGAGFRPSSLLLLGPLLLLSLERAGAGLAAAGLAALGATVAAWFLPMTIMSGGSAWASSLWSLWTTVAGKTTAFNSSPLNSLARAVTIAAICGLAFGGAALLPLAAQSKNNTPDHHRNRFLLVWIAPGLLFFTFVFLKFVNSGYLLVLFPPVCVWMGAKAASW